ncbi:hypothetical protein C8Q74DRAFT_9494 [Fomes fomentarius]|nr:hypothetical protein C8Q74DRAFT_9494 [Fomes fomentarius]
MDQLFPYTDIITPPTPDTSDYGQLSPASSYHTPYTSLMSPAALAPVTSPTSPYAPSYLPVPSPAGSSYVQLSPMGSAAGLPQPYYPSPTLPIMQGYQNLSINSPVMASPMSFYSMNSPSAMASTSSFQSISQNNSPAIPVHPLPPTESPAQWPVALPTEPARRPMPHRVRRRRRVPQSIKASFKRDASFVENFKLDGASGVPVRGILDGTVIPDGSDERVLEKTGVRQIRLVVTFLSLSRHLLSLQWPGYKQMGTYIIVQKDGQFITRAAFAKLICEYISRFIDKAPKNCDVPEWSIGNAKRRGRVAIDNLWLVRVSYAHSNIWVADLEVL